MLSRVLQLVSLMIALQSCSAEPIHIRMADEVAIQFTRDVYRKYGFPAVGSGGSMMIDVKEIFLAFNSAKCVDIHEARILIIELTEELVSRMNNSLKLRPYLHNYPATHENADITLSFSDMDGSHEKEGISFVFQSRGNIVYTEYDSKTKSLETVYKEPYEEALRIVRGQENGL